MSSTQTLTELPYLSYSSMDYDSVIAEIKDIIANNPNWAENWTSFYNSDAGTLFTQLMAWISDNLSLKQDTLYNEMFISTAQRDKDILRLLKLIDYTPTYAKASKVYVTFELSAVSSYDVVLTPDKTSTDTYAARPDKILRITGKDINGSSTTYELLKEDTDTGKPDYISGIYLSGDGKTISYTKDRNSNSIYMLQGKTNYTTFTSDTSDGPYFNITDTNIAQSSIRIYDLTTGAEHYQVDNFVQTEARDTSKTVPYVLEYTEDGYTRIRYANTDIMSSATKRFTAGNTIGVFYRTCNGTNGNIPIDFINTSFEVVDTAGNTIKGTVYNTSAGANGIDAESISSAALNGPLSIRTMGRAVTPSDYDIILDEYGSMLKCKSYTSANIPDGWVNWYGRYINPQEIFSFVILNKDYSSVPSSKYNYYPWITLKQTGMFNEKYIFDNASYDTALSYGSLYNKLICRYGADGSTTYNNAIVINAGTTFDNAIVTGTDDNGDNVYNTALELKLQKEAQSQDYFSNIAMTLLYDTSYDPSATATTAISKASKITTSNNSITLDTYARYISPKGLTPEIVDSTTNKYVFIDCKKYSYINFYLDNKTLVRVNLHADYPSSYGFTNYYLCLSNGKDDNSMYDNTYTNTGNKIDALYRHSIIELINDQIIAITKPNNSTDPYLLYDSTRSVQYLGLSAVDSSVLLSNIVDGDYYVVKINGTEYKFLFGSTVLTQARAYYKKNSITYPTSASSFNALENIAIQMDYQLACNEDFYVQATGTYVLGTTYYTDNTGSTTVDTSSFVAGTTDVSSYYIKYVNPITKYNTTSSSWVSVAGVTGVRSIYVSLTDLNSTAEDSNNNKTYLSSDIMFYTTATTGFYSTNKYILVEDTIANTDDTTIFSLLEKILNVTTVSLPTVIPAGDYSSVASAVTYNSSVYLQIKSPIYGSASSIFFYENNDSGYSDFMYNVFGLTYTVKSKYSYTAYGQKKLTMLLENSISSKDQDGASLDSNPVRGNIIFELNSISLPYDIDTIYGSYKLAVNNSLILGSVYDNFYYTGDTTTDALYKPAVTGLLGQYMDVTTYNGVSTYTINKFKSDYSIKMTKTKQSTNSIYAITSDVSAIPVKNINIYSANISNFSSQVPIIFSIDDLTTASMNFGSISLSTASTAKSIINNITTNIQALTDTAFTEYINNVNTIVQESLKSMNQILFSNITKDDNSNITFYAPAAYSDTDVKNMYKQLFGTNLTNQDLYTLYPMSMFPNNTFYVDGSTTEYYYSPITDKKLEFTYRILVNNVSTTPDYYIDANKITTSSGGSGYQFTLNKTTNSNFQDAAFYVHIINDRTYETDSSGSIISLEEDTLQNYMDSYKISGMELNILKPYFKTFDIAASITYNRNFSKTTVKSAVETAIAKEYSLANMEIGNSISKSKIYKTIMNIDGVEKVDITYFGYDYSTSEALSDSSTMYANFYEILVLHEDVENEHGLIFTYLEDDE